MKKKIMSFAVVMMMTLAFTLSVAAASPVAASTTVDPAGSTLPDGVSLVVQTPSPQATSFFSAYAATEKIAGTLLASADISLDNQAQPDGSVVVRVNNANVTSNDSILVYHYNEATGVIDIIHARTYNGYFTFVPNSFSPFFFVHTGRASSSTGGDTTPTSPQTGVYN